MSLDEPPVDELLVQRVLIAVRRRRARRAGLFAGACVATLAAVALPVLLSGSGGRTPSALSSRCSGFVPACGDTARTTAHGERPPATSGPTPTPDTGGRTAAHLRAPVPGLMRPLGMDVSSGEAQIYAAALHRVAPRAPRVYVQQTACDTVGRRPAAPACADGMLSPDVQHQLRVLLAGRVAFVAHAGMQPGRPAPAVIFGGIRVRGDTATLAVEVICGAGCGHGMTLTLHRSQDVWRAAAGSGAGWIT